MNRTKYQVVEVLKFGGVTRRSEGGNDCGMGGHYSAQHLAPRRQHSQTHSEPDNSGVDAGSVHNSVTGTSTYCYISWVIYVSVTDTHLSWHVCWLDIFFATFVAGRQSGWEATGGATGIPASGRTRVGGAPRSLLLAMHEYTSITDELETVYGLFSPPHTPR